MSDIFFQSDDKSFTLYHGDCLDVLPRLERTFGGAYADLVFADPPYLLSNDGITCQSGKMVSVNKGKWDKSIGAVEDHINVKHWLDAARHAMKPDATIWVTGTMHIIYSIGFAMQELGFKLLNDIVWVKPAPPPNLACRTFTHSTEIVLWAARNSGSIKGEKKSRYVFNYADMKLQNGGKQMKSVWEQFASDFDVTNLSRSDKKKLKEEIIEEHLLATMEKKWIMGTPRTEEKKFGKHPTQKPLALLKRIIEASSNPGQTVIDPFNGTGATGIMASMLGRNYIGIDASEEYLEITKKRYFDLTKEHSLLRV